MLIAIAPLAALFVAALVGGVVYALAGAGDPADRNTVIDYRGFTIGTRANGQWILLRADFQDADGDGVSVDRSVDRAWHWVDNPQEPVPADAAVSGNNPGRAIDTAEIYADGLSP